ncbi:PLAC8 family-domain-containing protein [Xylariaceae sp. FL1651]|nr:PLAC8 family-domain-containing protein [Xylariaceae sp. FL1651]
MSPPTNNQASPVDQNDIRFWTDKLNDIAKRPAEVVMSQSDARASSWYTSFFGCFDPIDTCLVTWCLPCVTFGKTHHRLHKDANLDGYEPINTSCLLFCGSGCCGLWWVPTVLQRSDIRTKYNLQGSFLLDLAASCCCHCCTLVQSSKEAAHRADTRKGDTIGYESHSMSMVYPSKEPVPEA